MDNNGEKVYPDADLLTFGGGDARVKVDGLLIFGTVAEISWQGRSHVLEKKSWMAKLVVNRNKVQRHILSNGDIVQVGQSVFRYKID